MQHLYRCPQVCHRAQTLVLLMYQYHINNPSEIFYIGVSFLCQNQYQNPKVKCCACTLLLNQTSISSRSELWEVSVFVRGFFLKSFDANHEHSTPVHQPILKFYKLHDQTLIRNINLLAFSVDRPISVLKVHYNFKPTQRAFAKSHLSHNRCLALLDIVRLRMYPAFQQTYTRFSDQCKAIKLSSKAIHIILAFPYQTQSVKRFGDSSWTSQAHPPFVGPIHHLFQIEIFDWEAKTERATTCTLKNNRRLI